MTINKTLKRRDVTGKQIQMSACVIFLKRGSVQTNIFAASRNIWNVLILWGCGISRHHWESHLRVSRRCLCSKTSKAAVEQGLSEPTAGSPLTGFPSAVFSPASVYQIHRCKIPSGRQTAKYYRLFGLTAAKCCKRQATSSSSARGCRFFAPTQRTWRRSISTLKFKIASLFVNWAVVCRMPSKFTLWCKVVYTVMHLNYIKNKNND